MATTHIDYRKIDYDQLLDKPITRVASSVNPNTLTTAGVYDRGDGNRFIVAVEGQNISQVIEKKDGYETRSSTDGGTTWSAWDDVQFSKSGDIDAEDVNYDNTTSELTATNVQAAIDEIDTSVDDVKEDITDIQTDITNIQGDITNIQGDITEIKNIIEVTTMDTPSEDNEGSIVQYKGATNANFTHGYFYECVSDGQTPATYSWERIDVQPAGAGDEHEFITQAAYDLLTPAQKAAKVYMIKEEGVPGSGLTAGAGIDITNNIISADMSTAVYDNTTSGATATNVQDAIDEVFQSVSNGKELIADAITDKGVSTSATDSFATMATNIGLIQGSHDSLISTSNGLLVTTKINAYGNSLDRSILVPVTNDGDNMLYFVGEKNIYNGQNYNFDLYSFGENTYQLVNSFSLNGTSSGGINLAQWWELTGDNDYYYIVNVDSTNSRYASKRLSYNRTTGEIAVASGGIGYHIENYGQEVTLPTITLPYTISVSNIYTTSDEKNIYNFLITF